MKSIKLILALFCLFVAPRLKAQSLPEIHLLVRISPETGYARFFKSLPPMFTQVRCVDQDFGLYSVHIPANANVSAALDILNRTRGCLLAQQLHPVKPRYTPNDPLVVNQNYLNVIKAFSAWNFAHGTGVTGLGDTVVVALIDDGLDTLQPDLAANVWRNRNEIPWNGVDDDSNGYTDDFFGWNGGDSNCRVLTSESIDQGHGTSVAGVIGAVSDNGLGIAGLALKTKILPCMAYSTIGTDGEIGVVRCMLYVWRQKKLYISSGGKKGANIVVANFSLGIDRAKPEDAPLWCAMYDSLGSAGIISCGATSDANNDVDVVGDIPTSCPSPYLIAVNFTNDNDVRQNSGYSSTQIDLAAPGQDIRTTIQRRGTTPGSEYANKSGTSFSTPLVTGTVALLYQNVCDTFLYLQKTNNDSAMRLMKSWILNGTDKLPSLAGKCLTEGRLNVLKSWQLMDDWCKARDQKYSVNTAALDNVKLFPNPMPAGQNIQLIGIETPEWNYRIYDLSGKLISDGAAIPTAAGLMIPAQTLTPGFYILQASTPTLQLVRKLQVF